MKRLCIFLVLALTFAALFTACTPDKGETASDRASNTLPIPASNSVEGAAAPSQTEGEQAGQSQSDSSEPGDPTQIQTEPSTEIPFSGLEIEDEYTETIGENIGVGGNE